MTSRRADLQTRRLPTSVSRPALRSPLAVVAAATLALAACAPQSPTTSTAPAPTVTVPGTAAPTPTLSAQPSTPASSAPSATTAPPATHAEPSETPPPVDDAEFGPTTYPEVPAPFVLYYVKTDTGGPLGCGDTMVPGVMAPVTDTPVRHAMETLLDDHATTLGEGPDALYNALAESRLSYVDGHVDKATDRVDVWLTGTASFGGTCDIPRVIGQLEMTALSAAQVPTVMIWVDDVPLRKVLDQRG